MAARTLSVILLFAFSVFISSYYFPAVRVARSRATQLYEEDEASTTRVPTSIVHGLRQRPQAFAQSGVYLCVLIGEYPGLEYPDLPCTHVDVSVESSIEFCLLDFTLARGEPSFRFVLFPGGLMCVLRCAPRYHAGQTHEARL